MVLDPYLKTGQSMCRLCLCTDSYYWSDEVIVKYNTSVSVLDSVEKFSDHLSLHFTLNFSNFLSLLSNLCRSIFVVLLVTLTLLATL